jgi:hypothetical protein
LTQKLNNLSFTHKKEFIVWYSEAKKVLLRANVRSVQSTRLIGSSGELVGMVSTHYGRPGTPSPDVLKQVDHLASSFLTKINA